MKKILIGALALSLLGGSVASAQPHDRNDNNHRGASQDARFHPAPVQRGHNWARGQRLPSQYRTRNYYVDYRSHHLRRPPHGYQWVRADNQYVLMAVTTGLIAEIIAGTR